jgi:hypothetical protein
VCGSLFGGTLRLLVPPVFNVYFPDSSQRDKANSQSVLKRITFSQCVALVL